VGAAVFFNHGDISPVLDWPGDSGVEWDCAPQVMPRYWRRNEGVRFQVLGVDGARLERSFTPDFAGDGQSGDSNEYRCARGQLTGIGFRQMAGLGRHLAEAYAELMGPGFEVRSLDEKRLLASVVGVLITLLTTPQAHQAFKEGDELIIRALRNATSAAADEEAHAPPTPLGGFFDGAAGAETRTGFLLADHLLARWCHQKSWPCRQGDEQSCLSVQRVASLVAASERHAAESLASQPAHSEELVSQLAALGGPGAPHRGLALSGVEGPLLTSLLLRLFGDEVFKDPAMMRPPYASRLSVERWQLAEGGYYWRVLWNGVDVTHKVTGCSSQFPAGCDDATMRRVLQSGDARTR